MLNIAGHKIIDKIYESNVSNVFRAVRTDDNEQVILKMHRKDHPSVQEIVQYKHEYRITRSLGSLTGVSKVYAIERHRNGLVIIFQDLGGESLDRLMASTPFSLEDSLTVAIQLCKSLGEIHSEGVVHKDINPSNIAMNTVSRELKIIDFGISTWTVHENTTLVNPNMLEGTLAYMSPEQTGRMNRQIDYRSDYYSLGVTLYELFTGTLPFQTTDPLELVHCHIAKKPKSPSQVVSTLPETISNIILKLLGKNSEVRYQSIHGIKADLELCLSQVRENGRIELFELARTDISEKLEIPERLYGREEQTEALVNSFNRVVNGSKEITIVSGQGGIGKTSLIRQLYRPVTSQHGYFVSGKFDRFNRQVPYSAILVALRELVAQILGESEGRIARWKSRLLNALGVSGQVIIKVIPELELVIGSQPDVPILEPAEARNRFNILFQNFIRVFCHAEHPLVMFLDDVQWADFSSLKLLELILADQDTKCLFLIVSYRDEEVDQSHPFAMLVNILAEKEIETNVLHLGPLQLEHVSELIADALQTDKSRVNQLAELVYQKTAGNPFYLKEFIKALYEEKLLQFDSEIVRWRWNLPEIQQRKILDNAVDLVAAKILRLPPVAQDLLKMASCIGNQFEIHILSWAINDSLKTVVTMLNAAVFEGLIFPLGVGFKPIELEIREADPNIKVEYRFAHDRIQYAAYSLIPVDERPSIHQKLGRLLLENTPADCLDHHIFDVVNQFNCATSLITDDPGKSQLAELDLRAGKKAKASTAYEASFSYFQAGLNALGKDSWETNYNVTLELHLEAVEAAYLTTRFDEIEMLASTVMEHALTLLDKVKVYEVRTQAFIARNNRAEAVRTSLEILERLGEKFPDNPGKLRVLADFLKTKLTLSSRRIDSLTTLPEMMDQRKLATMRVLRSVVSASYTVAPNLFALMMFKMVRLTMRYGKARQSGLAFAGYAVILCSLTGDVDSGYRYGAMALELVNRDDIREDLARVNFVVNAFIRIWRDPLRDTLKPLLESYRVGLEVGDLEYAAVSAAFYCTHSYGVGKELPELEKEIAEYDHLIGKLKQDTTRYLVQLYRQEVLNLMASSENPCNLSGEAFEEEKILPILYEANERAIISAIFVQKLRLCYMFYDYEAAVENGVKAEQYLDGARGSVLIPVSLFYNSLALLATFGKQNPDEKKALLRKVKSYQKRLRKLAHQASTNFMHKLLLIESEEFRVLGRDQEAEQHYSLAIGMARKSRYLNEEALAHERKGIFYLSTGRTVEAREALEEARNCYLTWGAMAKVKHLNKTYPELLTADHSLNPSEFEGETAQTEAAGPPGEDSIDLIAVLRASQTLSSEIILEDLLKKMMNIVIQIGGAEKGILLLEKEGSLFIEARTSILEREELSPEVIRVEDSKDLPWAVVNFVARTFEPVILDDAQSENSFIKDNYVAEKRPRSVLCLPIMRRGELSAVLYLENNQAIGAFTSSRVEMLKVLSAQAAISIENAKLYRNLEESAARYRSLFENAQEAIFITQDDHVKFFNPQFISLSGRPSEELTAQPLKEIVCLEDQEFFSKQQAKSLEMESAPNIFTFRIVRKDSTMLWVQNNSVQVDWLGRPATLNFLTDITDTKKASDLNVRTERLKAIADLAGGVAHNFNNVLQVVIAGSELALVDLAAGETSRVGTNLERIRDSSIFGAETVKRLQSFAKIRHDDIDTENHRFDLSKVVRKVADISGPWWKTNLEKEGIQINMELNLKDGCFILGKESELFEVLINLIKNAAEAMPDGGSISISTYVHEDNVVLKIDDTGTGIPESDVKRLFEPFWTTKGAMGTGLGLAVSHGIISSHGGSISVESKIGCGTTFTIKAPLTEVSTLEALSAPASILDLNLKILVVDDTEPILTLMRDMLTGHRQTVFTAQSGAGALDLFRNNEVDLVISDLGMPRMNGLEVGKMVKLICAEKGIPKTPFLLLTGWGGQSLDTQKIVESGVDGVLEKPINTQKLFRTIQTVVKKSI